MMQVDLNFNPYPVNPFKHGSQNHRVYERLKLGSVTNLEIVTEMKILNSTGRVSDVREFLKNHGMDVKARPLGNGCWQYRIAGTINIAA